MKKEKSLPPGFRRKEVIDKETGKVERITFAPNDKVRALHQEFIDEHDTSMFQRIDKCLLPHINNQYFVKIDIRDAFGTISQEMAFTATKSEFIMQNAKNFFHKEGGVIQGAPASPYVYALVANSTFFPELKAHCDDRNIVCTKYVDDILISSHKIMPRSLRKVFRRILRKHGFEPNPRKDKVISLWKTDNEIKVLGTIIKRDSVSVTEQFLNKYYDMRLAYEDGDKSLVHIVGGMRAWLRLVEEINFRRKRAFKHRYERFT